MKLGTLFVITIPTSPDPLKGLPGKVETEAIVVVGINYLS
jgi:hypothetical protein